VRTAFIRAVQRHARSDPRIWLLTGDLGYSVLEPFAREFPERYVNVGVAEQNMAGVAAGLAHSGAVVFTYSIANFPTLRCLEQIRNDICHHQLPVKIVAVGGGFTYGAQGYTHHGIEDLAIMRSLPSMTVVAPADPLEVEHAVAAIIEERGPCYLRLGKAGEPIVHEGAVDFRLGRAIRVREGPEFCVISTGGMLDHCKRVVDELRAQGHVGSLFSMHTLKPLDVAMVTEVASTTPLIVTVEEHNVTNGLGSAVADVIAQMHEPRAVLRKMGVPDAVYHRVGDQAYMRELIGDLAALVRGTLLQNGGARGAS
jgi:transketolase